MKNTIKILMPSLITLVICTIQSCVKKNAKMNISDKYLRWTNPYKDNDTVIFLSSTGLVDTVFFYKSTYSSGETRNFEQGYTKTFSISVDYALSKNSYHKLDPSQKQGKVDGYPAVKKNITDLISRHHFTDNEDLLKALKPIADAIGTLESMSTTIASIFLKCTSITCVLAKDIPKPVHSTCFKLSCSSGETIFHGANLCCLSIFVAHV